MKIAYFDCFSGISGDMILGSLIDAGADFSQIKKELNKLNLKNFNLNTKEVQKNGITGTKFDVEVSDDKHSRNFKDIENLINESALDVNIKNKSIDVFETLAKVEAKIHGKKVEEVHFHEVGAVDSIVDIVGSVITLKLMKIEKVYSSPIHVGKGFVKSSHGKIPVPAPATIELLKNIPIVSHGINSELTTPTGAVVIKSFCNNFGSLPEMKITSIGYGAGSKDLEIPNLLRVFIGEKEESQYVNDEVFMIETNIDDMNPEFFEHLQNLLFEKGALDVFMSQVVMKKSRPGVLLSVLSTTDNLNFLIEIILTETTSSGVRVNKNVRFKLKRELRKLETKYGDINIKVFFKGGLVISCVPEYEDCKKAAVKHALPLKNLYDKIKHLAVKEWIED